ncbi:MAG TPA: hypothetical protein VG028_17895 [Terriglobia bacterium]|nr:hypothetical protein [Terriglobia bacterium]
MESKKSIAWIVGVCLLFAGGVYGQSEKTAGVRPADAAATVSSLVEPDSSAASSGVTTSSQAVVPRLMKFSGVLRDAAGKPLSGTVDVTFSLYNIEAGGNPLWFETQSVQADELGRYTALLGAMHADGLPIDLFTSGEVRWLGIQVGSEAEQQPRVLLVSVPYALKAGDAETLGGKPASAYMLSDSKKGTTSTSSVVLAPTGAVQTTAGGKKQESRTANNSPLTACSNVTSDGTATANSIALFTTACNIQSANLVQFNGNLGFGTTTPQARLHIFGPTSSDSDARFNFILGDSTPAAAGTGGGILFSGYYNGTTNKAGFANIRGVKENSIQGNYATAMVFDTRANGGNQTERMRITSAGSLGIGTSSPAATLEVNGTAQFDGTASFAAGQSVTGNVSASGQLISTVAPGTAPLSVTSTTQVPNLNASLLGGLSAGAFQPAGSYAATNSPNSFGGTQTISSGDLAVSNGNLDLAPTTGTTAAGLGVINLGGVPIIQACCPGTAEDNTFIGYFAGNFTTTGSSNSALGENALAAITTGTDNTASGVHALYLNDTGNLNAAFGRCALFNTHGSSGTINSCVLSSLGAGSGNTGFGVNAGRTNSTGELNTFLGYNADASPGIFTNASAIGANAVVGESNALVLGSISGVNGATASVNVGIGTTSPAHTLDVAGDVNATGIFTGNGSGLTNVAVSSVTCTGCVTGSDIGSGTISGANIAGATISGSNILTGTVTGTNIASGTITGTNVSSTAGINPTAITGTAATLGALNVFTAGQVIQGAFNLPLFLSGSGASYGPELGIASTAAGGHTYTIVSAQGGDLFGGAGSLGIYDATAGLWREVIGPSGNVGIGTTAPAFGLDINSGSNNHETERVTSSGNDAAISLNNTNTTSGLAGREYWLDSGANTAGVGAGNFAIYDHTVGAARLVVNPAGNVGIGTIAPTQALDVRGKIASQNARGFSGSSTTISTTSTSGVPMPNMSVTVTTGGLPVVVIAVVGGANQNVTLNGSNSGCGYFSLVMDGTTVLNSQFICTDSIYPKTVTLTGFYTPAAGSHTFVVNWAVYQSGDTEYAGGSSSRTLVVMEM